MAKLGEQFQSADWKQEKHSPVIECPDSVKAGEKFQVTVSVGKEIAHPNTTEHHIRWIQVFFKPDDDKFSYQLANCEFSAHGESAKDTGVILGRYGHAIAIRHDKIPGEGNTYLREVARWSDRPVINMQCDVDHPCQTLADLMTIREEFGKDLSELKIAVSWAYAPSYVKPMSVPQGLIILMTRFGMNVTLAHPPEYALMDDTLKIARQNAKRSGGTFDIAYSMEEACDDADIVYPKSWGVEALFSKPDEAMKVARQYRNWICDETMMARAKESAGIATWS